MQFTEQEVALIRYALEAGLLGVVVLGLAYAARLISQWLDWKK